SSRRRHTRFKCDWSSDVCSSDLGFEEDESQLSKLLENALGDQADGLVLERLRLGDIVLELIAGPADDGRRIAIGAAGMDGDDQRSEERRVGKEGRSGWWPRGETR